LSTKIKKVLRGVAVVYGKKNLVYYLDTP